ncbi:dipicolinate synthase subunit DpsA [Eubacteriales bacterium OttesenSCG-928-G02]|nr:dipicolinate synthase subunit DpsA [Eubacteriales bacterium OttesenSCG-928-G02]
MDNRKVAFIGGDRRQLVAAECFAENGYEVYIHGFEKYEGEINKPIPVDSIKKAVGNAGIIILPLPYSTDKQHINTPLGLKKISCEEVLLHLNKEQILFGGKLNDNIYISHKNTFDYYECEELKILNAIPTAEGAIAIAMNELPVTLHSTRCAILGFGRIGKILAHMLKGLGSEVTIYARKESDLALAEAYGYKGMKINELSTVNAEVIYNTVPTVLLTKPVLEHIDKNTLIIDLAARPGGIDFEAAKEMNLNVIWALSLPGKFAPVTAGEIIYKCISSIIAKEVN